MAQKQREASGRRQRTPPPPDPRRRLPVLLRHAWYALNQAFRRRIAHLGLTPDQFTVLRTLLEGDARGMTQRELAQTMASDANTIASILERMEAAGLVQRQAHEQDRRAHRIVVCEAGRRKFADAGAIAVKLQAEVLQGLPGSARADFLRSLSRVAVACKKALGNSPTLTRRTSGNGTATPAVPANSARAPD